MNSFNEIIKTLNTSQFAAVNKLDGPILVSAGAGSGKTRVLSYRIANLIETKRAKVENILAVTFTNKAAQEMKDRIHNLIKKKPLPYQSRMWIGTFHSICARILRENKDLILSPTTSFTIYDSRDQLTLIKKVMRDLNINEKIYNPKTAASQIAQCKRRALGPQEINPEDYLGYSGRFQEIYHHYENELRNAGAFDFESLLFGTYKLFLKYPECLKKYREKFLYISVDEYQDTNHIQYLIIKTLAEKHRNICVVGDEDQSIYSWRGADISNILNFDHDFPECKIVKLEKNYRSTKTIISVASALINHNRLRKNKQLFTDNPVGTKIQVCELEDEYREAHFIATTILKNCQESESAYKDFAIFYRTNAQSRVLEDSLRSLNIPYKIIGNLKFYDRAEIKDILSYLKFLSNLKDEVSLKRILNTPRRGIGNSTIEKVTLFSQNMKKSFYEALIELSRNGELVGQAKKAVPSFIQTMESLIEIKDRVSLFDFCTAILEKTGYLEALKADKSIESLARLENLQEFVNAIVQFEMSNESHTLEDFLEEMSFTLPDDHLSDQVNGVTLMTLHISKGLEFDTVFISGMEEDLFPLPQTASEYSLEEERRLAYVGITRAQKNLFLSFAKKRHKFGKIQYNQASQFLNEIPKKFIYFHSFVRKNLFKSKYNEMFQSKKSHEEKTYYDDLTNESDKYRIGQTVYHHQFGPGTIQKVEGNGENLKISVLFRNQTVKKFIAKYAHFSLENNF